MSRIRISGLLIVLTIAFPSNASAKDLPIEVWWTGAAPTDAFVSVPGGVERLRRDGSGTVLRGTISIPDTGPQRRTITVRYGNYSHPFDIRVHPILSRVVFTVDHQIQRSCTQTKVKAANSSVDNLLDAIKRSVDAGELLSIQEPNACDRNLRFGAAQAKFRQNAAMGSLSNGLFLINRQIENEYKAAARARGVLVDAEVASLQQRDGELEVRQLLAFRSAVQGIGDYASAIQVTNYMKGRLQSDLATAAIFTGQGVTKAQLDADEARLTSFQYSPPVTGPGPFSYARALSEAEKKCRVQHQCPLDSSVPCPPC